MKKVDDQGASVSRTIFRVILIVAIAAGIRSVHAENNRNNNTGAISVERIKHLTDHGNHEVVQIKGDDIKGGSSVFSPNISQGHLSPRNSFDDDDADGDVYDDDDHAESIGGRRQSCPLCQSKTHTHASTRYGGGRGRGSGCGRGECSHSGRRRHLDVDGDGDGDDDDDSESDFSHHYDYELSAGSPDEDEEEERFPRKLRKGVRGNRADDFIQSMSFDSGPNDGRSAISLGRYKNALGDRGGGMSYGSGRRGMTNGHRGIGYLDGGGNTGHYGYHEDGLLMNSARFIGGPHDDTIDIMHNFFSRPPQPFFGGHPMSPSVRRRMVLDSSNRNGYMLPNDVIDTVQDLIDDPSTFYVTFACQPKVGKYLCKIQCVKRNDDLTGSCDSGYCHCILKTEKKDKKRMNKRFLAAMEGFKTDCATKAKKCKRYCKDLTPDKSFTGLCSNNKCRCVTFPNSPDSKKNACTKAIQKLKKIEDQALRCLGLPAIRAGSSANYKLSAVTNDVMNKLHDSKTVEGCTPEDIQNLRGIISNLAQGLNYAKTSDAKMPTLSSLANSLETPATPTQSPRTERKESGFLPPSPKADPPASKDPGPDVPHGDMASRSTGYYSPSRNYTPRPSRSHVMALDDDKDYDYVIEDPYNL